MSKYSDNFDLFLNATEEELAKKLQEVEEFCFCEDSLVSNYCDSPFAGFHPEHTRMVVRNDDYYLGLRANHFVLMFGRSEALPDWSECLVCLANHKGALSIKVFTFL